MTLTQPATVTVAPKRTHPYWIHYFRRMGYGDPELGIRQHELTNSGWPGLDLEEAVSNFDLLAGQNIWPPVVEPISPTLENGRVSCLTQFPCAFETGILNLYEIQWLFDPLPERDHGLLGGKPIQPIATDQAISHPSLLLHNRVIGISAHIGTKELYAEPIQGLSNLDLSKKVWLAPTAEAMYSRLVGNDTLPSGARSIQPIAAKKMLDVLFSVLEDQTPPPSVVPTWNGGVQVEWHRNNVDFEVEYNPQRGIEYYFCGPDEEEEGELGDDTTLLARYVKALL